MARRDAGITVPIEASRLDTAALSKKHAALIVVQGTEIGRDYRLRGGHITIGRSADADVRILDEQASRSHAHIEIEWHEKRGVQQLISDAGSTNGTFVNSRRVHKIALEDGDKIQIGGTVLKFVILDNVDVKFHAEIRDRINYDALTGLLTKESLYLALESELQRCNSFELPLAVLMMDLDWFKSVNDTYGHPMGSHVLAEVGRLIRGNVRDVDVSARYGGEEFVSYLAEADMVGAQRVGERIREAIEAHHFVLDGTTARITISIGIAVTPEHGGDLKTLVKAADRALYAAKNGGRNRVCLASVTEMVGVPS
jgi:two-component system cell cycle response regulator